MLETGQKADVIFEPRDGRKRGLTLFNLAVDSKLRGCDVVTLNVEEIVPNGY